jgi:hypothetical protein
MVSFMKANSQENRAVDSNINGGETDPKDSEGMCLGIHSSECHVARKGAADETDMYVGLDEIGDSNTRSRVSRKTSRKPTAVLADASTNSAPMRDA